MRALIALLLLAAACGAHADLKAGEKKAQLCLLCHKSASVGVPLLEAQPEQYLVASIHAYKSGARADVMQMRANTRALTARDINDIAGYLASRPAAAGAFPTDARLAEDGRKLAGTMNCASCHGAAFTGAGPVPRLAGQSPNYLLGQLEAFAASRRSHPGGPVPAGAEAEAVSQFLASLR